MSRSNFAYLVQEIEGFYSPNSSSLKYSDQVPIGLECSKLPSRISDFNDPATFGLSVVGSGGSRMVTVFKKICPNFGSIFFFPNVFSYLGEQLKDFF